MQAPCSSFEGDWGLVGTAEVTRVVGALSAGGDRPSVMVRRTIPVLRLVTPIRAGDVKP